MSIVFQYITGLEGKRKMVYVGSSTSIRDKVNLVYIYVGTNLIIQAGFVGLS